MEECKIQKSLAENRAQQEVIESEESDNESQQLSNVPSANKKDDMNKFLNSLPDAEQEQRPQTKLCPTPIQSNQKADLRGCENQYPVSTLQYEAHPFTPVTNTGDGMRGGTQHATPLDRNVQSSPSQETTDVMTRLVNSFRLPQVKVEVFSGNPLQFPNWESSFNSLIESRTQSPDERLNLLSQHLSGEPKSMVSSYLLLQTEEAYIQAKAELKQRYGNNTIISKAFIDKLASFPKVQPRDAIALRRFSDLLNEFAQFIKERAREANIPAFNTTIEATTRKEAVKGERRYTGKGGNSYTDARALATNTSSNTKEQSCPYCKETHHIDNCGKLMDVARSVRKQFFKQEGLCYACGMTKTHRGKDCTSRVKCKKCSKEHLTPLHFDEQSTTSVSHCISASHKEVRNTDNSMIIPVWVRSKSNPNAEVLQYCVLDPQSNTCFISRNLQRRLGIGGHDVKLTLSTMQRNGAIVDTKRIRDLEILSYDRQVIIPVPTAYTRDHVPAERHQIPTPEIAMKWDHLRRISGLISPYMPDVKVGILIGNNVPSAIRPRDIIAGAEDHPYGQRSILGWGIVGKICSSPEDDDNVAISNRIVISESNLENQPSVVTSKGPINRFTVPTTVKELVTPQQVQQMFERDFIEHNGKQASLSVKDQKFISCLSNNITQREDGHYEMPLPLHYDNVRLPNNRPLALKRALQLKRRFRRNPKYKEDYFSFMKDILTDCAERVPSDQQCKDGDRDLLRFLWWEDGDLDKDLVEYRMTVHLFGAASSPGCANFGLQRAADDGEREFGEEAARFIREDFYVDDGLKSLPSVSKAINLINDSTAICAKAGLKLHKWISNKREVLDAIPVEARAPSLTEVNTQIDHLPIERVLGMTWCVERDCFQFRIELRDLPFTRRGVLATISSVYDPLGFVAPVILTGKVILQELCRSNADWDDPIPEDLRIRWMRWRASVVDLERLNIQRCYKPDNLAKSKVQSFTTFLMQAKLAMDRALI
ncbi:uncharacterized protein [Ptychodera flava]|uniref:uncharacterized protein n=1 Tax=Ptychodera flava TaxID=63121 RepID=UPI00396A0836